MVGGLKKVKLRGIDKVGGVHLHRGCLQLVPIAKPDGQSLKGSFDPGTLRR
jgi:hypothetical protein